MSSIDYFQLLKLSGPEAVLAMAALAVLAVDLIWMRESPIRQRQGAGAFVSILGCLGAGVCALQMPGFWEFRQRDVGDRSPDPPAERGATGFDRFYGVVVGGPGFHRACG